MVLLDDNITIAVELHRMLSCSSVKQGSLHGAMTFEYVNCDLATPAEKATRSNSQHRVIRPVRQGARRTTWPRAVSRLRVNMGQLSNSGRQSYPSLRKAAQWCLDAHSPSQRARGTTGLLYAVPSLPPLHDAQSVVRALDETIAALNPEQKSPAVYDNPDDLEALFHHSLNPTHPSAVLKHAPALADSVLDLPSMPDLGREHLRPVVPVLMESLVDVPHLPDHPVVGSSSTPLDDLLTDHLDSARLCAPLIPTSTVREGVLPSNPVKPPPKSRYPGFQKPRQRTEPHIRRIAGTVDLKARAATLSELKNLPPQRTPTCLRVGAPARKPNMTRKLAGQDSLKIRVPSGVKDEDLPRSLQHGGIRTCLSPGPDAEIDCLVAAVDGVQDSFRLQLDPLESDLGNFALDLPSPSTTSSGSLSSHLTSNSQTCTTPPLTVSSRGSSKKNVSSHHVRKTSPRSSKMDDHSQNSCINRPLPPPPPAPRLLKPEVMPPARTGPSANLALSNATLKALLSAEDAANAKEPSQSRSLAQCHLSQRSAALVREFSEFTHRSFFNPPQRQQDDLRSQSDGALVARQVPLYRSRVEMVAATSRMQPRARSVGTLAERKVKGRGMVFADPEAWKAYAGTVGGR